ncbi:hypothetical protein [Staphylococcus xylosus]|uniref:hypothetical protein n=1 Tax=Staphylococcus xylosus TaxID=1288 RepID=UPI001C1DFBBD|nr:hypothetical protein [Staphylococcus xylosus]MBU6133686.1 hypothetical protein [Staphylococcus xylosus]MCE7781831.1 hypothetical protein [Staphylococcus xylosus]MEB8151214.1 hypothetical protein [Staphylococcus xylosus]
MKNPEANDTNWFTIIFSASCAIMSKFMDNHLFRKIILALMILSFIYTTIKNLKITLYGIKTEDVNVRTWIGIKVDYWIIFVKNMIAFCLVLGLGISFLLIEGKRLLIAILTIAATYTLLLFFEHFIESKTDIYEENYTD